MKSKNYLPLLFLFLAFSSPHLASGQPLPNRRIHSLPPQIYSLNIHYWAADKFPALIRKTGVTIAIAPFKDTRRNRQYIGQHVIRGRISGHFQSEPFPLEKSLQDVFVTALRSSGVKPFFISGWDGKSGGLKSLEKDSVLKVLIRRFWIKSETTAGRTRVYVWVYLDILLGVKKLNKVLSQSVYVGEETIYGPEFSPQALTNPINRTLRNVVESFFGSL